VDTQKTKEASAFLNQENYWLIMPVLRSDFNGLNRISFNYP